MEVAGTPNRVPPRGGARARRRDGLILLLGATALALPQVITPAARATVPVQPWEAAANAAVLGVAPSTGGIYLTSTLGEAHAAYDQTESQATSAFVDLGGLGYVLSSLSFCGQSYPLSKQPQLLTADSGNGASSKTAQAQLYPGVTTPTGTGAENVSVSPNPEQAEARTYSLAESVPGLVDIEGVSQSDVRYVEGQSQEADATVTEDLSLLGGKVTVEGLKWNANQKRGMSAADSAAAFSYGSVNISGLGSLPVTIPGSVPFDTAIKVVNDALATVGIALTPPSQSTDPGTGSISISPLHLHFSGSALDDDIVSPSVGPLTQLVNLVNGQVTHGGNCTNLKDLLGELSSGPETVLDLLVSGFSGSGGVDLYLGGASAETIAAPDYTNPFDATDSFSQSPLPPTALPGISATSNPDLGSQSAGPPALPAGNQVPVKATPPGRALVTPAAMVKCVTTNPTGGAGCWRGVATWAGAAAVALAGGLLAADVVYGRRKPRPRRRRRLTG